MNARGIDNPARPKRPGETKIVAFMGGDRGHNAIPLEYHMRGIFSSKRNWRMIFVLSSRFFSPELIADADLLITSRHSRPDDIDWRTDGLAEEMSTGAQFWTDENARAIEENITKRGMGFLAMHNTLFSGHERIVELLGVEPVMHNEIQPLWIHGLNETHPVTRGIGKFMIKLDEQFAAVLTDQSAETLFESTAMHDKREAVGAWSIERGKGRIAAFLPGHLRWAYRTPQYREMIWRAVHWAMRRDIPAFPERM